MNKKVIWLTTLYCRGGSRHAKKLVVLVMCLFSIITMTTLSSNLAAQSRKISLDLKNSTVQNVIEQIESKTDYLFIYSKTDISSLKKVSVQIKDKPVYTILDKIFEGTDISYKTEGRNIVLTKVKAKKTNDKYVLVKGFISNKEGKPVIGASVVIKGTVEGTVTGGNGYFELYIPSNTELEISCMGYKTVLVKAVSNKSMEIQLDEDEELLDEIVVVGYGTQKKGSITSSVSMVSDKEILKAPTMSVSNIVGSRVAGIAAVQSSGQPGKDAASLTLRGQSGIIYVIDGIRRTQADFNEIDPNEIESVSVLKDASAVSIYGLDANGAIIVTTKRGKTDKFVMTYTGTYGLSNNAEKQEWLDGPQYAYWYNKAREMDGDPLIFTKEQVNKMINGVDGWGNTNWYDLFYGTGHTSHHNISASGGTEKIRFFASLGYLSEEGNIDKYNYDRMNIRSNVDAKLTDNLTFSIGLSVRMGKHKAPRYSANPNDWHNLPQQIVRAHPYVPAKMKFEGKEYYVSTPTASSPVAPGASIYDSGYNKQNNIYLRSNFSLKYAFPWLKGLVAKFQGAYDFTNNFSKVLSNPYKVMLVSLPSIGTDKLNYSLSNDAAGTGIVLSEGASRSYNFTTQTSLSYNNMFGKHSIGGLLLAETRENKSNALSATGYGLDFIQLDELGKITGKVGDSHKEAGIGGYSGMTRVAGFVSRVNYSYDNKYYAELSMRYDGSYLFGGMNKRWVALPGASAGWRISNESWFKVNWIDDLKIRGGIGKTATSGVRPFQWRNTMGIGKNSVIIGGIPQSIIWASVLGNPNLTWSKCLNYNIGLDATILNGLLGVEFDVFYKYQYDMISGITGSYAPSRGGYYFNSANVNKCDYKGFDMTLSHNNHIGNFNYGAKLIWSYAYGRWLKFASDNNASPEYQRLTGKQIGVKYGFIAEGLFQSEEEIKNSPTVRGYKALPGYIKYRDRNGDGIITADQDQGYVGKSSRPTHTGSLNIFGDWKGFDFDMLFSWGLGGVVALTGQYTAAGSVGIQDNTSFTKPFYHGGNSPRYLVENAWTPEHTNADFPRLEIAGPSNNNGYSSTFWYRNGDYLRLKTAQLGYTLPKKITGKVGVESMRMYIEGYNLLTFSKLTKYNIDPESPAVNNGYYPQQRKYSIGVKLTF